MKNMSLLLLVFLLAMVSCVKIKKQSRESLELAVAACRGMRIEKINGVDYIVALTCKDNTEWRYWNHYIRVDECFTCGGSGAVPMYKREFIYNPYPNLRLDHAKITGDLPNAFLKVDCVQDQIGTHTRQVISTSGRGSGELDLSEIVLNLDKNLLQCRKSFPPK